MRVINSRRMKWAWHVTSMEDRGDAYRLLVGRPEGKRSLGRPRHRWEDSIKMDVQEVGWADIDWSDLVQDRDGRQALVNAAMNLKVP
jgi:hypothetical protein